MLKRVIYNKDKMELDLVAIDETPTVPIISAAGVGSSTEPPHTYCGCFRTCCWMCRLSGCCKRCNRNAKSRQDQLPNKPTRRSAMNHAINKVVSSVIKLPSLFWWLITIYMLASFVYFSTLLQTTTLVGIDLGLGNEVATQVYSTYGITSGVCTFLMGILVDRFGTGTIAIISVLFMVAGRVILTLSGVLLPSWTVWIGLVGCAALSDGALFVACRATVTHLFTQHPHQRKIAFALLYASQNVGAMLAGVGNDITTQLLHKFPHWPIPVSQTIMGITVLVSIVTLLFTIVLVIKLKLEKAKHDPTKSNHKTWNLSSDSESASDSINKEDNKEDTEFDINDKEARDPKSCMTVLSIFKRGAIYRFLALNLFCVGVRSIFRYMDTIFPLVLRRVFGPDVPVGSLYAIDPLFIIFLAPLIQALIAEFSPMRWIVVGMWISSLSPMLLAFATPDKLGLMGVILFGIAFAIGEAFWSPRLDDYASEVAKPSEIGVFMASIVPFSFVAKIMVGFVSNWLLTQYCPIEPQHADVPCDMNAIWGLVAGITAVISPLLLTLCYDLVYDPTYAGIGAFATLNALSCI